MLIPEDGCLPKITRTGLSAFNNVMIIKVPVKFRMPGEPIFHLATLDRAKKGERWPADGILDAIMNPTSEEEELNSIEKEKCPYDTEKSDPDFKSFNYKKRVRFLPKKLPAPPRVATPPETSQNSYFPVRRKPPLLGVRPVQELHIDQDHNSRNFTRSSLNQFSNDHSRARQDNYSTEGLASCLAHHVQDTRLPAPSIVEPALLNRPFNEDFRVIPERPVNVGPSLLNRPFNNEFRAIPERPVNIGPALLNRPFDEFGAIPERPGSNYPNPGVYHSFAPTAQPFHGMPRPFRPPYSAQPSNFHHSTIPNPDFVEMDRINNSGNNFRDFNAMPGNSNLESYDQPHNYNNLHPGGLYDNYNDDPNNGFNDNHDRNPHFEQDPSFSNNSNQPYHRQNTGNDETNHNFNGNFRYRNKNWQRERRPRGRKFNGGNNQRGRKNYRFQKRNP